MHTVECGASKIQDIKADLHSIYSDHKTQCKVHKEWTSYFSFKEKAKDPYVTKDYKIIKLIKRFSYLNNLLHFNKASK